MKASALYTGDVLHARHLPRPHVFRYRLHLFLLDLDELESGALAELSPVFGVERWRLLTFLRKDYLGDASRPLADCVRDRVEAELGQRPQGAVRLLTHVRAFGYVFNPVSFYYCHHLDGTMAAVVAEINNTPWNERHAYVVPADGAQAASSFDKRFHVSPFFPMTQRYRWRLSAPGPSLSVHMENHEAHEGKTREVFRARLTLSRQPLTRAGALGAALRQPALAAQMHAAIYLQAGLLRLKGMPFFPHPHTPVAASPPPAQREPCR